MLRIGLLLLVVLGGCSAPPPASAPVPHPESAAVIAVANGLFDAMRTRDTAAIHAMFQPTARVIGIGRDGGRTRVSDRSVAEFAVSVATAPDTLHERMWSPEVRIDGDLATLWAPYDFHRGARFSHCGYDAFQFARVDGAWRITALSFTGQREGCPPAPPR